MTYRPSAQRQLLRWSAALAAMSIVFIILPTPGATQSQPNESRPMSSFRSPMVNLYSRDLPRATAFYADLGFKETFRTPASGPPAHVELQLDGFTLGVATVAAAREHGLQPEGDGRWIEIVLWTGDVDAAVQSLRVKGVTVLSPAHDFLNGRIRSAWIADPDGNPIQLVQRKE